MADQPIRWSTNNFLGLLDTRWVLTSATIVDGVLTISAGGKAVLDLVDAVNAEFKYIRLVNTFTSAVLTAENNYRNKPTIFIEEVYKGSTNVIDTTRVRSIGFNTTNVIDIITHKYKDETIYETLDRKMAEMKIVIKNQSTADLVISGLEMYQSSDISTTQVNSVVNQTVQGGSAASIVVYRNVDKSINGLGVIVQGSTLELKYRPAYDTNGQIISIDTNYGQTISIQNILGAIDVTT